MINADVFMKIINDKGFSNLKKLSHKYGTENILDTIGLLKSTIYKKIKIKDFNNNGLVFCPSLINISDTAYFSLLNSNFNITNLEDEIENTLKIENISSNRNSIRNIVKGMSPTTEEENKIYGIKKGLDFISDKSNAITEKNLHKLYILAIENYLSEENQLNPGAFYRNDSVYIVGDKISHQGISHKLLPQFMNSFISFINSKDNINIIIKSTIIHFYFSYLHPYFDGNGRMARLLHLWYLIQNDFDAALMVSFSKLIANMKNEYYKSFELIEENEKISGVIDVTPFIMYFNSEVFSKLTSDNSNKSLLNTFEKIIESKPITPKEKELFIFILSNYQNSEFSTKQLEKDYKNVSYETVRKFVCKFEKYGLLSSISYSNRIRYKIR